MSDLTKAEIADLLAEHTTPSQTPCACPPCRVLRQLRDYVERLAKAEGLLRETSGTHDYWVKSQLIDRIDAFLKEQTDGE